MTSTHQFHTTPISGMGATGCAAILGLLFTISLSAQEPISPEEGIAEAGQELTPVSEEDSTVDTLLPTYSDGYYPTMEEADLFGGDYARSRGGFGNYTPDARMMTEQGLYQPPNPGQYDAAPWAKNLSPMNPFLGFFAPRQALVYSENSGLPNGAGLTLDAQFPFLVRDFSPERAMFKAGPLYMDILSVGMTVLHSDFQGANGFPNGSEDGWLMGTEFSLRALAQFTDQFYLSIAGSFIYLPLENEFGFAFGAGGSPGSAAALEYQTRLGSWDIRVYDVLSAAVGADLFGGVDRAAFDQAGRYSFGFNDNPSGARATFEGDSVYLYNTLGFQATHPALWDEWIMSFAGRHMDSWNVGEFGDRTRGNELSANLAYNGTDLLFRPSISYIVNEEGDDFDEIDQRLYLNLVGRLSQTITLSATAGHLWSNDRKDTSLYGLILRHQISSYTYHALAGGQDYFRNDITGDTIVASYGSYTIGHQFSRSLNGSLFVQLSDDDGPSFQGKRTSTGGRLDYALFGGTNSVISLTAGYENLELTPEDSHRWVWHLNYSQKLSSRVSANIFYQYEEQSSNSVNDFNEQLIGTSIRKYF